MRTLTSCTALAASALVAVLSAQQPPPAQPPTSFEIVSIRPSSRDALNGNNAIDAGDPCSGGADARLQVVGTRLVANTTSIYSLVALAYNPWNDSAGGCSLARSSDLLYGPEWIKSERFAIQAVIPTGVPPVTSAQLWSGEATGVTDQNGNRYSSVAFRNQSMARLAQRISSSATIQRPVLDRTGLMGAFDFVLEFDDNGVARPTIFAAVQEQLGLRLQPGSTQLPLLVIDGIQRPTED